MKLSEVFSHWDVVRSGLIEIVDKFSDADLKYIAFPGSMTVGRLILHIADAEDGWFRYAVLREYDSWPDYYDLGNYPTKHEIINVLREVHKKTTTYLETLTENNLKNVIETPWGGKLSLGWIIWHVLEHEIHHRGELSLILGLLGREGLDV